jgi:uncharacterized protein DUF2785
MIYDRCLLKEKLKEIKKDNFRVPNDLNVFDFALNMMEHIGDTDPEMRDSLIYAVFFTWIDNNVFTVEQLKQLLNISLDDNHLFFKIGEQGTDSVFTRSFSVLIVALIVYVHRRNDFLSREDLKIITYKSIKYMTNEKDVRGYIENKGWAHSAAHTADVLNELAQCSSIEKNNLVEILQVLKTKVCINNYVYINQEDERMAIPVINIIKKNIIDNSEIINWIKSFRNVNKINHYPEDDNLVVNIKSFLRSIYFGLLKENVSKDINKTIEETLYNVIGFFGF